MAESSGDCVCCPAVLVPATTDTHCTPTCDDCGYGVNVVVPIGTGVLCPRCAYKMGWDAEPCDNEDGAQ